LTIALFAAATPEAIGQEFTAFFLGYRGDCHASAESCNFRHAVLLDCCGSRANRSEKIQFAHFAALSAI
jgi:hypothetical protein